MAGLLITCYFVLFYGTYVSFLHVFKIDEYEYKNELQKSFFKFKRKIPFIFSESGSKTVFSKKTFILQVIGYAVCLVLLVLLIVSFFVDKGTARLLGICSAILDFGYGIVTSILESVFVDRVKKKKETAKPLMTLAEEEKAFLVCFKQKFHPSIYEDDHTEGALFLETVDFDVIPLLLCGGALKNGTRKDITEGYRRFLENADPEAFDEYAKAYFEDVQAVMRIFEKYYGTSTP